MMKGMEMCLDKRMMDMNINQLQYLVDVGELGSFTEAAKKNLMTVPAISVSISQLENELGMPLFSRSRKGVVPTFEGEKAIQYAISILKTVDQMKQDLSLSPEMETIVVASIPGMVPHVIHTTLELRKNYPMLNIQMVEHDTEAVLKNVKNGHADMGFVSFGTANHEEGLTWEPVIRDEAVLVVPKSSALRFNRQVEVEDIQNETIVLYNDPYVKKLAESLLSKKVTERVALISNNVDALLQMVLHGQAITIATAYIIHSLPAPLRAEVITIPLHPHTTPDNYLWRVTRKHESVTESITQFTNHLLSQLQ
jgi:DNA-binding transcriptional LysR family regulator